MTMSIDTSAEGQGSGQDGAGRDAATSEQDAAVVRALGLALGRRRQDRGLAQEDASERCGFHRTYWGAIERGRKNVPVTTLVRMAGVLGCKPSDLLNDAGL
jgi:ribosome-binding protein aMBF1 (putative translation factor)